MLNEKTKQEIVDAIIEGNYPIRVIQNVFGKEGDKRIWHIGLKLFDLRKASIDIFDMVDLVTNCLYSVNDLLIKQDYKIKLTYVKAFPPFYLHTIANKFIFFLSKWYNVLYDITDLFNQDYLRSLWQLSTETGLNSVVTIKDNKLNLIQQRWVLWNKNKDKELKNKEFNTWADELRFWLQPEMYKKAKEQEEARVNINYEKQHAAMIAGTFGDTKENTNKENIGKENKNTDWESTKNKYGVNGKEVYL